jgi:hypothetical protein
VTDQPSSQGYSRITLLTLGEFTSPKGFLHFHTQLLPKILVFAAVWLWVKPAFRWQYLNHIHKWTIKGEELPELNFECFTLKQHQYL